MRSPTGVTIPVLLAVFAQYTFLGDLRSYQRTPAGIAARCDPGATLEVRFIDAGVVRVTLDRPNETEDLLDYPVAPRDWPGASLTFVDETQRLVLRSDRLTVVIHKTPCRVDFLDARGVALARDDSGMGIGWDGNEVRAWKTLVAGERFYGLGEKTGDLEKTGREWVMWNSDTYAYGPETDPLYESIPFLVGLRDGAAWGMYLNNSYRTTFNLGAGNQRYFSFSAEGGPLDYFFFSGVTIADVVREYTALTGRAPLPPRWALGYQQSRWSYYPAAEVLRLARTFREKRIPADVIYLDIDYMDGYRVFTWDPQRFPDPAGMLRQLDSLGFKIVTIVDPGVKADTAYAVAREGLAGRHFVRYPDGAPFIGSVWPGPAYFPDFTRAATRAWWGKRLDSFADLGVAGFWNDMNEPAVWGKAFPVEVEVDDGGRRSTFKKVHNLYALRMAQATYESLRARQPARRPFVLTRAGFSGTQTFGAVWTGDNVASWDHLELGILMMLGLGLSGVPFVGTDVGGFVGAPSPELFARWLEVGVFSPLFRTHATAESPRKEPWSFGEDVEAISREAIELRYRLLPYLYTLFREAHTSGAPILRPLFWHYPSDSSAYDRRYQHEFLVGADLLVAPVTRDGQRLQQVYLPAGRWLDMHSERVYAGPGAIVVPAPLEQVPMFLRESAMLPGQEPVQYIGERAPEAPTLDVFPGAAPCELRLYEDDGETFAYERGGFRETRFTCGEKNGATWVERAVTHAGYPASSESPLLVIRLHAVERAPHRVRVDGRDLRPAGAAGTQGYTYDARGRVVTVRVRETGPRQRVTIE